jgi:hypothetical protein
MFSKIKKNKYLFFSLERIILRKKKYFNEFYFLRTKRSSLEIILAKTKFKIINFSII